MSGLRAVRISLATGSSSLAEKFLSLLGLSILGAHTGYPYPRLSGAAAGGPEEDAMAITERDRITRALRDGR